MAFDPNTAQLDTANAPAFDPNTATLDQNQPAPAPARPAAPAAAAPAPSPVRTPAPTAVQVPANVRAAGPDAIRAFQEGVQFRANGNTAQARLAVARVAGYIRAHELSQNLSNGGSWAFLTSFAPRILTNTIARLGRPANMSDDEFQTYLNTTQDALQRAHGGASLAGGVVQALAVPGLGAESAAARGVTALGARGAVRAVTRLAARASENAVVGGALDVANTGDVNRFGEGAAYGAAGGEVARVAGHGLNAVVRRFFPGRSNQATRVIQRALDELHISPDELNQAAADFRTRTGREGSALEVLRDPRFGERGQIALNTIDAITRRSQRAAATMQNVEAEAIRADRTRRGEFGSRTPETSRQSDVRFGQIADNPVAVEDAAALAQHQDIGGFIRPRQGEVGIVPSQTARFRGATNVAGWRQAVAESQTALRDALDAESKLHGQPNVSDADTQRAADAVTQARQHLRDATGQLRAAEAHYEANPVTVNDLDAVRQVLREGVQKTGNARIGDTLRQHVSDVADRASGGQYSANVAAHAAGAQAEEEALSRGLEGVRAAAPGSVSEGAGGGVSHATAGAIHAINHSPTGAGYHFAQAFRSAGRGTTGREAELLAQRVNQRGGVNAFAQRLEAGRNQQLGLSPDLVGRTARTISRTVAAAQRSNNNNAANPFPPNTSPDVPVPDTVEPTSMTIPHDAAERMLMDREAFRANVYHDAGGHPTIGYGHLIKPGEDFSGGITESAARELLRQDIVANTGPLADLTVQISEPQKLALISFGFNAGPGALRRVIRAINRDGNFTEASRIIGHYTTSGGRQIRGLAARRQAEIAALNGEGNG